eukprot:5240101-Amphidinium_carterae.1
MLSVVDLGNTKPSATSFAKRFGHSIRSTAFAKAGPLPIFLDKPIFGYTLRGLFFKFFGPKRVVCEPMDESGGLTPPKPAPYGDCSLEAASKPQRDSARKSRIVRSTCRCAEGMLVFV